MENDTIKCFGAKMKVFSKSLKYSWRMCVQATKTTNKNSKNVLHAPPPSPEIAEQPPPILTPDLIMEILGWLPLKTLSEVRLVCKEWRTFVTDHYFIEKHMDRTPNFAHHWYNIASSINDNSARDIISFLHGCDGLIVIKNLTQIKYCIWNPVLHRVLELPDPHHQESLGLAILYVPSTRKYSVVYAYTDASDGEGCEIFTPGQSTSWKCLKFPQVVNSPYERKEYLISTIVAGGGAVHFVLRIRVDEQLFEEVISLDIETEQFTVNHLPKSLSTFRGLDWEGNLAFAKIVGEKLEVRQLTDYKKQRWCEKKEVIHLSFLEGRSSKHEVFPLYATRGVIWFWSRQTRNTRIIAYGIHARRIIRSQPSKVLGSAYRFYPYKPTLVSFQGMVPDANIEHYRPPFIFH